MDEDKPFNGGYLPYNTENDGDIFYDDVIPDDNINRKRTIHLDDVYKEKQVCAPPKIIESADEEGQIPNKYSESFDYKNHQVSMNNDEFLETTMRIIENLKRRQTTSKK